MGNALYLQWRSIALSVFVALETIYFGVIFVENTLAEQREEQPANYAQFEAWSACLVFSGGDKTECLSLIGSLGLGERKSIASLFMSAVSEPSYLCHQKKL